jgi:hypothetical protein
VLSILVWWAIPAVAVVLAVAVAGTARRIRRAREDIGTLYRYQRARQVLERTQGTYRGQPSALPAEDSKRVG